MIYVLYHQYCLDGFGAAFSVWLKFGDQATYVPVNYQEPFPPSVSLQGNHIIIVDFSYPKDVIENISHDAKSLTVIDHHKTAQEALAGLECAVFDMDKAGCVLAWEYFFPANAVPQLLLHVQDRDLWQFQLEGTKEVCEVLWSRPREFERWEGYAFDIGAIDRMLYEGRLLLMAKDRAVNQLCKGAFETAVLGRPVVACNAPLHPSEVCAELLGRYPAAECAIAFAIRDDRTYRWSFRSRAGSDVDVADIAKTFGGGGHKHAAGATTPTSILGQS